MGGFASQMAGAHNSQTVVAREVRPTFFAGRASQQFVSD